MIAAFRTRLGSEIPELTGRVRGAGNLAELTRARQFPQVTPAAHVLPAGMQGGEPDAMSGAYTQDISEGVSVVLTVRDSSPEARRVLDDLRGFILRIIEAIVGWAPENSVGVFRFVRAELVSSQQGTFIYQIDFAIADQLRIS
ncbi:phage tail terminator protein [Roseobacter sp. S98]|uniref:phage tail terminator protein n=1 Tax=Roseobacter algicola (ex Choi et al. 2025) (nom. illeg.) TaxID=3092138 RepID=UPI003F517263